MQRRFALDSTSGRIFLIVTRLDRLARSTRDLLNLLGTIAEKGAGFLFDFAPLSQAPNAFDRA
jgi:hypothetical protein